MGMRIKNSARHYFKRQLDKGLSFSILWERVWYLVSRTKSRESKDKYPEKRDLENWIRERTGGFRPYFCLHGQF
jgi:hypothetical protein